MFWVIVRFFLLSTETSVLVFGLAFGHLDSQTSIRRVLLVTSFVSLAYSICQASVSIQVFWSLQVSNNKIDFYSIQGCLEIIAPDESFYIVQKDYYLFSHGGMIFWFCTCLLFSIIYLIVFLLPWTPWVKLYINNTWNDLIKNAILIRIYRCRHRIPLPSKRAFYSNLFIFCIHLQ